ncbi:MAG: MarR family transcriptional regulator [Kutzneria sp.]|nr:MarR family transcriptional regulator [Kutzneria sp.]MBV9844035.1 MarR family transcriptional regulator [Kutzneria sp.]
MATQMPPDASTIYRRYLDAVGLHGHAVAEAAGLHTTDWYALSILALAGSLTSGELAERTNLTTGATTRLIDRLESAGHVRRVRDSADRRRVVIEPTPDWAPKVDAVVGPARQYIGDILASYTPDQLEVLFDYFARAAPAFHKATAEIRQNSADQRRHDT